MVSYSVIRYNMTTMMPTYADDDEANVDYYDYDDGDVNDDHYICVMEIVYNKHGVAIS